MSLDVRCDRCGSPLDEPGGLAFSPPLSSFSSSDAVVRKFHVCLDCWPALEAALGESPVPDEPTAKKCESCGDQHEDIGEHDGMALCFLCQPCPTCGETGGPCDPYGGPAGATNVCHAAPSHPTGEERDR